ncbi:hypothetical protein A3D77_03955 [Candidatus Gottesmanbacteria bacterium RIFCSPHIGHO2_02_FULL_39_11]|uniref:Methyltransferase domain-containing protein n=1 Tax=Candidatus Gottesmanbacteria bacterium RIFCSPHIGHO2_02_FULL_39_11 TaxID=1798382 RepID=A0A1F5ZJZ3_9BACT|nr:MAG: hypothetical protein A3D77_03955 [Candidatus Gottesmanbacteria bacterium RIFCSPHIGHO2_02_FULL_39_11]
MAYMTLYHEESSNIVNLMQNKDPFFDYLTAKIMMHIPPGSSQKRILDLGCGGGRNSVAAAKKGYTVIGLDYVEKSLVVAGKLADLNKVSGKIFFKKEDITKLKPKQYGIFDYIIL